MINQLNNLFTNGISITVKNQTLKVYFVLFAILGDNLGVNCLLGFNESFVSDYYCRFCKASKYMAHRLCCELSRLLRNEDNYKEDVENSSNGVKSECIFNSLPFFHSVLNPSYDLMHDWYLGVCRYDFAQIFAYCIKQDFFSKQELDHRLEIFECDPIDRGNKVSHINPTHIEKGQIILTSSQMSYLVSYLGVIIGDLIPEDDPVWELYLLLFDILNFITSSTISEDETCYVNSLIQSHNQLYQTLFNEDLKPKYHFTTHYSSCIRTMGPLKNFSCEKFERFHQKVKKRGRNIKNKISILCSIANKIQLELSHKFLMDRGFEDTIKFGSAISSAVSFNLPSPLGPISEVSYCKFNKQNYKPGYGIVVKMDEKNDVPVFGLITRLIKTVNNNLVLMYKECCTIGLNTHIKGYIISLPSAYNSEKFVQLTLNNFIKPFNIKKNAEGLHVVCMRYLS